ncbi:LysE/ArgO family amino acid transporter [Paenibacillus ferrarius]|uniref:LysE/ArgO family amino acid transporter n=1 Tax=Paenibacillus ferrarius TaxID=1469647 RepID=UPI003D2DC2F7
MQPLLKGILLGLSIAAPVGPIGVLCIRRTLTLGRLHGFLSGLGAATADAFYGIIAGFGLTLVTSFLLDWQGVLQVAGGLFLCYLGVQTFRAKPASEAAKARGGSLLKSYASTLGLTITNPMTILSFFGAFAGLGIGVTGSAGGVSATGTHLGPAVLVLGVFTGSALWWLALSVGVGLLRDRLGGAVLVWINRISGVILTAFGCVALGGLLG